jgi:cation diffusion facilitator CzcD-associated flavoprotein CzcO
MLEHVKVAIIGSGFAGLGMAIQLSRHGIDDFVVVERAGEVGGTWRDNTYPGAACDIRSDLYSFSFAPAFDWKFRYGRQPEILAYLRSTADEFGIRSRIHFDSELLDAIWDSSASLWRLHTSTSDFTASVLVSGAGPLIDPVWPKIPGIGGFAGERFHSSRWRHDIDLAGLRVAVIGTGASAIQFVPEVQKVAGEVTVSSAPRPGSCRGGMPRPPSAAPGCSVDCPSSDALRGPGCSGLRKRGLRDSAARPSEDSCSDSPRATSAARSRIPACGRN